MLPTTTADLKSCLLNANPAVLREKRLTILPFLMIIHGLINLPQESRHYG